MFIVDFNIENICIGQTDRQRKDRQTNRQKNRQTEKTNRQKKINKQTDRILINKLKWTNNTTIYTYIIKIKTCQTELKPYMTRDNKQQLTH